MLNYDNSIIYKICCNDLSIKDIYVGATTNFKRRKNEHKTNCRCPKSKKHNRPVYKFIRDNGGIDNWSIIILERFKAIDKEDLKQKEREWFEKLEAKLNYQYPSRTLKEYNKSEKRRQYHKNYRNTEEFKKKSHAKNKERINCPNCNKEMARASLSKHKKDFH
jgi:group I intron endonuclease